MVPRWMKILGLLLLCVYAAAMMHQVLPHHHEHGDGGSCALCLLLSAAAVLAPIVAVFLGTGSDPRAVVDYLSPDTQPVWAPFSLRGPPSL